MNYVVVNRKDGDVSVATFHEAVDAARAMKCRGYNRKNNRTEEKLPTGQYFPVATVPVVILELHGKAGKEDSFLIRMPESIRYSLEFQYAEDGSLIYLRHRKPQSSDERARSPQERRAGSVLVTFRT